MALAPVSPPVKGNPSKRTILDGGTQLQQFAKVDRKFLEEHIADNQPFEVHTASGRVLHVAGADFIHLSPQKTTAVIFWIDDEGDDRMATVPLLTITSLEKKAAVH